MLPETSLDALILKAIQIYNLTHSPQTKATLIQLAPPLLVVQFSGILCFECSTLNITRLRQPTKKLKQRQNRVKTGQNHTNQSPHHPNNLYGKNQITQTEEKRKESN
jgi:hypothetical protein